MKFLLTVLVAMFSLSAFAAPQVKSTIDQCIQANKTNPDRYSGCYGAVINQVRTQAKEKVQQSYKEDVEKAEQQNPYAPQANTSQSRTSGQQKAPGLAAPQFPSKSAVQPKQQEPKKAGPRIKYY